MNLPRFLLPLLALACALQAKTALPAGEPLLAGDAMNAFSLRTQPAAKDHVRFSKVDVNGPGFTRAWSVATLVESPLDSIELRATTARVVKRGDVALLHFFARATKISDETGGARVYVVVRRNGVAWNSSFECDYNFGHEWQEVWVPFAFEEDFAAGEAAIMLRFGFEPQTLEIGGLDVVYYGQTQSLASLPRTRFTYAGREADAPWRKAALARIERMRKSDFAIEVVDSGGKPIPRARVHVDQQRSAFQWGTALQMERLVVDTPDNLRYREIGEELFNSASTENDLKWPVWLGEWDGNFSRPQTLAGLRWLKAHGFHTRGHVLVWPGEKNLPRGIQERLGTDRQSEIPGLVVDHMREITRATKGLIDEWDVLNEPFTNGDLMRVFGDQIMPEWFKVAHEEIPGVPLYLNDFSNHDRTTDAAHVAFFERTARYLLEHGAPLGGLGLQAHFNGHPNAPENILAVLDHYRDEFHLPVRMTEFDVWTNDEELQADFTRDFLILSFSHPSVVGVQFWGFWETAHWRPSAAMFRADWSEKPNAKVYRDLVLTQWRTHLAGETDGAGRWAERGFQGDYVVTVESEGKRVTHVFALPASAERARWRIVLP
ncbi:endo-1,4-beta-xylanase [Horticoccus luteus]|uniref:Beta-xylanase n=1 Tax=Horticoccus luteus TaxID=2862869 RepID=A0A8F9TRE6_9BACT|nr:endo-1,4-beta-xylanase [Horticoccus luteus]QYM77625.1 endo-1,4-beta-xylanase [Horticoccus luteus]